MKIRAQIAMVLNLDKCIGCHTCSVTCKNVWTSREGVEYAWFNNVETKPGVGYPKEWENQDKWKGGWVRNADGKLEPRIGGKWRVLANIFANPDLPEIDDYYEPFTFDYQNLQTAPEGKTMPTARPVSLITGEKMDKINWGPNWEEILGGEFEKRSKDKNFDGIQKEIYGQFENTFMMYLPRLCEHCLNPACVASCPSGSIYKREEDGIVLVDQDKCRGWRMCVSGCPYKKIYYNWQSGKAEKCTFCFPRIEVGQPTVCSETCVGRIRYLGVVLYDADRIETAASVTDERNLYKSQLDIFLDPKDPGVIEQARKDGVPDAWLEAARQSPIWKMAMEWKVALPLHPEYRTLPMVWYIPPLSPIQGAAEQGHIGFKDGLPDLDSLRIPVKYLANLLTAGDEQPVRDALTRMFAMRVYQRGRHVDGTLNKDVLRAANLTAHQVEEMYSLMAIANYEDRFVIPTTHREYAENTFDLRGTCGFSFGNGCADGVTPAGLFGAKKTKAPEGVK
ncbi:nitrate reductase beta subunit [Azospirillum fermentarium]|uniref:nitrate reductase subunit beta n=1 Tax=Azospirillum fermentarium TaxID=1233114 RepID=UPI00222738CA|nr:nitrate reductase subunit beta [Azospirillum fermentarium]MCW2248987.1 nitrate reductase beta subunit [Azospirillum fermentarium]